jgi:saccharopine dehydrogenase (NADP+, L-glutamate forming)
MKNIHWLGSGLSSIPGIRRLASNNYNLTVWNRTLSKAQKSIDHVKTDKVSAKTFNINEIEEKVEQGDIIVSQLTASMHLDIAKICLEKKCHFVTTSYLAPDIKKLNEQAVAQNLTFINEVGLDPGIDHFFSHLLVQELKSLNLNNLSVSYKSYCGGIPAVPNDFKYKFSWSPVGVIKALNSPAKFTQDFEEKFVPQPYKEVKNHLINNESFEAYPNRDSLPYIEEYLFSPEWKIKEFVRGTLRLNGWTLAWREIFNMLEKQDANIEDLIQQKSNELWKNYRYDKNEEDRVVLWVNLEAEQQDKKVFSSTYQLDEKGSGENTAMAKLVSITLSAAVDLMLQNKIQPGVQAAPSNKHIIDYFFKVLSDYSIKIDHH